MPAQKPKKKPAKKKQKKVVESSDDEDDDVPLGAVAAARCLPLPMPQRRQAGMLCARARVAEKQGQRAAAAKARVGGRQADHASAEPTPAIVAPKVGHAQCAMRNAQRRN